MGKYEKLKELPEKQFRRLTGVQQGTFEKMVVIILEAQHKRYRRAGRKGSLGLEDKLLMAHDFKLFKESKVRWTKERLGVTDIQV